MGNESLVFLYFDICHLTLFFRRLEAAETDNNTCTQVYFKIY